MTAETQKLSQSELAMRPKSLAHLVLRTPRFKQMVEFYQNILGARISYSNDNGAFLQYDEEHHRLAIFNMPQIGNRELQRAGMDHIAFSYDTLDELFAAYKARQAKGIHPYWSVNHGMTTSMYYNDPDNNVIEFQVDTFKTSEEALQYFKSSAFNENPVGVDYDPEDHIKRLASGESEKSVLERPESLPRGLDTVPVPPMPAAIKV